MRLPLTIKIWQTLRRAVKALSPEGRNAIVCFVQSQNRPNGYCGAGGQVEPYYTQFGLLLECVLSQRVGLREMKLLFALLKSGFYVRFLSESKQDTGVLYDLFFRFINAELRLRKPGKEELMSRIEAYRLKDGGYVHSIGRPEPGTNATCSALTMLHQMGASDEESVRWLQSLQDETGGFRATKEAPIPDLLSTAVATFTLSVLGIKPPIAVTDFVESHWLANGGFSPTLLDEYSDVEYVFYGLLALGSR